MLPEKGSARPVTAVKPEHTDTVPGLLLTTVTTSRLQRSLLDNICHIRLHVLWNTSGPQMCLLQVRSNIQAAKEALGVEHSQNQHKEDRVLHEVQEMLKPIKNMTWPSGRPENNTE